MNTYNENLQNTVLASLQAQDLAQKNLKAQYNASKFTLYFAEGATITAKGKLTDGKKDLKAKNWVKEQATHTNNIANNLLSSATQANTYLGQSVSNTAVCAANAQIAGNAITRLASDVGSIFSIVNAADFDSDIYSLAKEVKELVDKTAYDAEYASQLAMNASTYTSEVSSATVLDNTKTAAAQMSNVTQIASAGYEAAAQMVTADNATFVAAISAEKAAEGSIECTGIDYNTAKAAYKSLNEGLNLSLRVDIAPPTSFTVKFDPIRYPFPQPKDPIENYYIIVVKESRKTIFTLSDAEGIALNSGNSQQFATLSAAEAVKPKTINYLEFIPKPAENGEQPKKGEFLPMVDSDNQEIVSGVNYVVFLLAVPTDDYKRKVNDFDDLLSAPSQAFCITDQLAPAQHVEFGPIDDKETDQSHQIKFKAISDNTSRLNIRIVGTGEQATKSDGKYSHQLTFDVEESAPDVAYRCMLLPASDLEPGLLTASSFKAFFDKEKALSDAANTDEPKIAVLQTQMAQITLKLEGADDTDELQAQLQGLADKIKAIQDDAGKEPKGKARHKAGFIFDLTLAEQVSSGNYMPAVLHSDETGAKKGKKYVAYIGPDTTDNFGNMLVKGRSYIPAVLSVSTVSEDNQAQYANALSDFEKTDSNIY